jgi:hypothetical protein
LSCARRECLDYEKCPAAAFTFGIKGRSVECLKAWWTSGTILNQRIVLGGSSIYMSEVSQWFEDISAILFTLHCSLPRITIFLKNDTCIWCVQWVKLQETNSDGILMVFEVRMIPLIAGLLCSFSFHIS